MTYITVSRTQWQWLTSLPYTDGVFSCNATVAEALVKAGYGKYTDMQETDYESMKRIDLITLAKSLGIKTSRNWKKTDVIQAIQEHVK